MAPPLKNPGPLLVDKLRGYFDRLPEWLRSQLTVRVEKQKVDAKISDLDPAALESSLKQEVTDEKLRTSTFLGEGEAGSGNDMGELPASHVSEVVIIETGQVADVTETVGATEDHLVAGPPLYDGASEQVGELWVTKRVETAPFDDKSYQAKKDDLMPVEFRAAIPELSEKHTIVGEAVMPTLGPDELVREEAQKKVGVKSVTVTERDTGDPPTLVGKRFDPDFNGAKMSMTKNVVPATSDITQIFGTVSSTVTPYSDAMGVKETWTTPTFPNILLRTYDPEIDTEVLTDVVIVEQGAPMVTNQLILGYQDRKIDNKHSQRTIDKLGALPASFIEYSTQQITFPAILSYLSFSLVQLVDAAHKAVQWTAGVRSAFTAPTTMQVNTDFFFTRPVPQPLFIWRPTDIIFKGLSYSVNLSNVLTDGWTNIGVTYAGDAVYGSAVDRFNINATQPSATAYVNTIGQYELVSVTVEKYKKFWVRKNTYIVIL